MRYVFALIWCTVALLALALALSTSRAQDGVAAPAPQHKGASTLESCLKRAVESGKLEAKSRKTEIARVSSAPQDGREYDRFLVVIEFRDGTIGLFQGGTESELDQFVSFPKGQATLVGDALCRTPVK